MEEQKLDIFKNFRALENNSYERNYWGYLLNGRECDTEINVTIYDKYQIIVKEYQYKADNAYTALLYQYEIAKILKKSPLENCSICIDKRNYHHKKSTEYDYNVVLKGKESQISQDYKKVVEKSNQGTISALKQQLISKKAQNQRKQANEDTLLYFMQKYENNVIKSFERVM